MLGLGTKWGLFRYWWVLVKLVLNLLLCTLIVVVLQPGMDEVAAYGEDLVTGSPPSDDVARLFFPPAVSLTCLVLATVLAVFKPWGRVRRTTTVK
jgi:predicted lysophospholipase L1 biosynthesis ABC-type transport system permease subunit